MMEQEWYGRYEGVMIGDHPVLGRSFAEFEKTKTGIKYSFGKIGFKATAYEYLDEPTALLKLSQVLENGFTKVETPRTARNGMREWMNS